MRLWFSFFDQRPLYRKLDQDDERTKQLKHIREGHESTAANDIAVRVMRCFAGPAHALTEEGTP